MNPKDIPAFPVTPTDRGGQCAPTEYGMTLRDYFAAHATDDDVNAAIMTYSLGSVFTDSEIRAKARMAHADAMLAAREAH